ncbi:MAG: hypothetical protein KF799_02825 [Bdellovibrionales bacterium]|nr:hypothetical protein [Bdellovibrionales bacterium]
MEVQVPLIFFLCSMFGLLFVVRTVHVFRARSVIAAGVVTKTGTVLLALLIWSAFWQLSSSLAALFLPLFLALLPLLLFLTIEHRMLARMKADVPLFIDRWILNMRFGNSVKSAWAAALRDESPALQALLTAFNNGRAKVRGNHVLLSAQAALEIEEILAGAHAPLERLQHLRRDLRKSSEFRRKSGQAVRQTAIQSLVMLVLLFALATFTVQRYGWTRSADFVTLSTLLSAIGVAWMCILARKSRWNL